MSNKSNFKTSHKYWVDRYSHGGCAGIGSYGIIASWKAYIVNRFLEKRKISHVIDWGCGDGYQASLFNIPDYIGYEISTFALMHCLETAKNMVCLMASDYDGKKAELTMSLDVIYHLVEKDVYEAYMERLFDSSTRYVIIYSTNEEAKGSNDHVKHRKFSTWVNKNKKNWQLIETMHNPLPETKKTGKLANFYFYEKKQ